jgi:cytochrome c biogenesis protein CcmG/thiol:disulfide interchange protein DsbE
MNMSLINKSMLVGAIALTLCTSSTLAGGKGIKVGDTLPELSTFGLQGQLPDDLKGKVVLLDFWASWCGPCKESFPVMDELQQKYGAKGLVILAVNVDEKIAAMQDFLKDHPVQFNILHDATKKLVGAANIASMPTSFLIGKDGKVVAIHKGFHGKDTAKEYVAEVEKLLAGNVASK